MQWLSSAEIVERRRQADGGLAAVSAAADFSARLQADITYDFSARNVHEASAADAAGAWLLFGHIQLPFLPLVSGHMASGHQTDQTAD